MEPQRLDGGPLNIAEADAAEDVGIAFDGTDEAVGMGNTGFPEILMSSLGEGYPSCPLYANPEGFKKTTFIEDLYKKIVDLILILFYFLAHC